MRTTLILDKNLLVEAKQYAARTGTSVSALASQGLREILEQARRKPAKKAFQMPVYGGKKTIRRSTETLAALRDEGY